MRIDELKGALDNFVNSKNLFAILIDGKWGIGKTYYVTKYLEKLPKKQYRTAYTTIFGKSNIAELNTELFNCLNKRKNWIVNAVNPVIKLVSGVSAMGFSINLGGIKIGNKVSGKRNKQTICVIDDLERKLESIEIDQIVGYINSLILQNIKVICLTYSNALLKDDKTKNESSDLIKYKEKVFDRVYQVDDSDNETLTNILKENAQYLSYCEFLGVKNVRTYIKANTLFNEIKEYTKYNDFQNLLFAICLAVVHEEATNEITNASKKEAAKSNINFYSYTIAMNSLFSRVGKEVNSNLFEAILKIYYNNDYQLFKSIVEPDNEWKFTSLFYLSIEDRKAQIEKQIDFILNHAKDKKDDKDIINSLFRCWYGEKVDDGDTNLPPIIDTNTIYEKLYAINFYFDHFHDTKTAQNFIDGYQKFITKKRIEKMISDIKSTHDKKIISKIIHNACREIKERTYFCDIYEIEKSEQDLLIEYFESKDFFIIANGTITDDDWSLVHTICIMTKTFAFLKDSVRNHLKAHIGKYKDDKLVAFRINGLLSQYQLNG